jgi:threonylcarbamoyladenosine tRNA methylthiotransferase MtaB
MTTRDDVVTLGCRLNLAESEAIRAMLAAAPERTVVVNSCAVTAEAVRQSRRAIRRLRRAHPDARLVVTGCAATITPDIFRPWPKSMPSSPTRTSLPRQAGARDEHAPVSESPSARLSDRHTRAFVPVQTGCDHACTFCIIPLGRGHSVSGRPGAARDRRPTSRSASTKSC